MNCTIADLRDKQVVCVKSGQVLGYVSDIEIDTKTGTLNSIVIYGKPRFFGLLGKRDDIYIPWCEIEVIGPETILVSNDSPFCISK